MLREVLPSLDLVLVMTVNPGFGGQTFIESMLDKVTYLRAELDKNGLATELEVDGGINAQVAPRVVKAGAYSRGMTQRLGIAQALIKDPELLILDEPTAGVDPAGARVFKELVSTLNSERGKTVIMCTHLLHEVGPLCTHVAIMNRGKFGTTGRVDEIVKKMLEEKDTESWLRSLETSMPSPENSRV